MRVEEECKKIGYFWLPGQENNKISGVLSISDGGRVELEVIGCFSNDIGKFMTEGKISRIIGEVESYGLVTLDNNIYIKKNNIKTSKILVNRLFIGVAWGKEEAVTFNTFSFEVEGLYEWVYPNAIKITSEESVINISYCKPKDISFSLTNGIIVHICFFASYPCFPIPEKYTIDQKVYFKLESLELRPLEDFMLIAFRITSLMNFAMDEVVAMKNISATSEEIQNYIDNSLVRVKIYYENLLFSEKTPNKNKMLFTYDDIQGKVQDVFNNWINSYEFLSPALSLYFSTKIGAQKYLNGKFLALVQGLETYHRRTSKETLMKSEDFESLVSKILHECPKDHVNWLTARLIHGNEISLHKRLKRIVEPFKELLGTNDERSKLLKKIVDTRNYLTHYSENLKNSTAKGRELSVICQKIEVIFNLHFLNVIGFSSSEIATIVNRSYTLKQKLEAV